jgi:tetratricopeptide (TPR) repeat protein
MGPLDMSSNGSAPDDDRFLTLLRQYQDAVNAENFADAEAAIQEIFAFLEEWRHDDPSPDFDLTTAAVECEENGDWAGEQSTYSQILSLPGLEPHKECRAHSSLASLCLLLNRQRDALSHARRATAAARRADTPILLGIVLQREARCLIRCGNVEEARSVVAEALSVMDKDKACNQLRASILILRAECAVRSGRLSDAGRDLDQAFGFLRPMSAMDFAAGIHGDLARWWCVTARLRAAREDHEGAVKAWNAALSASRHVASLPHAESVYTKVAVADMLKGLAGALSACGRADHASAAIAERKAILKGVGVPENDVA